jgi:glutaredoxin 3
MDAKTPVIIYSAVWCGFCHMAKNYMDSLGIKYVEKDVDKEPSAAQEAVQKSGQMGIPVIDVNGTVVLGFDRPRLDEAFKANKLV